MAITNFIPTVWGENLYKQLSQKYVAVSNCSRNWEGDIKQCGDRVKISGLNSVSIFNYNKNADMPAPATLSDDVRELVIDQAKAFNFQIDDVDLAQSTPDLMDIAVRQAADALANEADRYIYNLCLASSNTFAVTHPEAGDTIDAIIRGMLILQTNNAKDDIVFEVSPQIASYIYKDKLNIANDNGKALENGYLGSVAGCKIFVSNNIRIEEELDGSITHYCLMRTKRAVTFADQLSEIEAYRPERRFADAVKGLHLYGAKIIYPDEFLTIKFQTPDYLC